MGWRRAGLEGRLEGRVGGGVAGQVEGGVSGRVWGGLCSKSGRGPGGDLGRRGVGWVGGGLVQTFIQPERVFVWLRCLYC